MSGSYTASPPCASIGVLWDCFTFTFYSQYPAAGFIAVHFTDSLAAVRQNKYFVCYETFSATRYRPIYFTAPVDDFYCTPIQVQPLGILFFYTGC
jgi:hypothetical protein